MKTKLSSTSSLINTLLDMYIYYVVIKKSHKKLNSSYTSPNSIDSNSGIYRS